MRKMGLSILVLVGMFAFCSVKTLSAQSLLVTDAAATGVSTADLSFQI